MPTNRLPNKKSGLYSYRCFQALESCIITISCTAISRAKTCCDLRILQIDNALFTNWPILASLRFYIQRRTLPRHRLGRHTTYAQRSGKTKSTTTRRTSSAWVCCCTSWCSWSTRTTGATWRSWTGTWCGASTSRFRGATQRSCGIFAITCYRRIRTSACPWRRSLSNATWRSTTRTRPSPWRSSISGKKQRWRRTWTGTTRRCWPQSRWTRSCWQRWRDAWARNRIPTCATASATTMRNRCATAKPELQEVKTTWQKSKRASQTRSTTSARSSRSSSRSTRNAVRSESRRCEAKVSKWERTMRPQQPRPPPPKSPRHRRSAQPMCRLRGPVLIKILINNRKNNLNKAINPTIRIKPTRTLGRALSSNGQYTQRSSSHNNNPPARILGLPLRRRTGHPLLPRRSMASGLAPTQPDMAKRKPRTTNPASHNHNTVKAIRHRRRRRPRTKAAPESLPTSAGTHSGEERR